MRAASSLLFAALLTAACGGPKEPAAPAGAAPATSTPVDPAQAGTVTGRVVLEGTPPPARVIRLDGDPKCIQQMAGQERRSETYVLGDAGALANVFVYVKDGAGLKGRSFPVPTEPVVIDQQKCWYTPRVVGVRVGQPLEVRNSDPLLHNVRANPEINDGFNMGQPVQGIDYTHTFATSEVMVPLKCDVHAWMNAWIGVVEHPYFAVTGGDGTFSLANLPAGTYTLEAWHEAGGTQTATVTITPGQPAPVSFTFKVP
jgi:plastocyanin